MDMNKVKLFLKNSTDELLKDEIIEDIPLILVKVKYLFQMVKETSLYVDTQRYFDDLQKIQEVLAILLFRENILMIQELENFVRDCDRLDDQWLREHLFKKIKQGEYSLEKGLRE